MNTNVISWDISTIETFFFLFLNVFSS